MDALKTVAIFVAAVVGELSGTYAVWRWRRAEGSVLLVLVGALALLAYAVVQTLQTEDRYGRLYAAYAGVFLVGAMLWGWLVDGTRPDVFDLAGAIIVLVGASVILWGREVLG
jgi:small multidrug resistance family-3 protein